MDRRFVLAIVAAAAIVVAEGTARADLLKITGFTPPSGPVGTTVVISGGGMSRVNAVAFAGVGASFRVDSARQVTATVPDGASTGRITVTRPGSTVTSATDFTITTAPESTPWSSWQHDAQHSGRTGATGPSGSAVTRKWVYKAVNWIKNEPAIGTDGTVYIGDSKFPLCALSGASGALLWCTDVGGYVAQSSPAIGNPFVKTDAAGTRTVQTIYIGERNNVLWAIDDEGDTVWSYKIALDGDVRASPLIGPPPASRVFMMCGCTTRGVLHAFDPSGALAWVVNLPQVREASPAGILRGATFRLYVITNHGELIAVDDLGTRGEIAWTLPLGASSSMSSPSIGPDGTIYVGTEAGLFAVRDDGASGHVVPGWPFATAGNVDTTAAIAGSKLYVSSFRLGTRRLYAIDAAGGPPQQLWSVSGPGTSSTSFAQTPSAVIGGNGLVYAAIGPVVSAFDPASANPAVARWQHTLPADAISLTLGEGVLYVSAKDARLYALGSP